MKNLLISTIAPLASLLLILGAGGCYTQLGTVRNEGAYEGDTTSEITGNSAAEDDSDASYGYDDQDQQYGYGEDWGMQSRFGFNYYYPNTYWPSVTFSAAYADPWGYWYGYDPWYYRPYAGYYSPWFYYGYGYSNYYSPWYGYGYGYYSYYPGYYYQNVAPVPRTNRNFGSTRASGGTRGNDPNGYSRGSAGSSDVPGMIDLPAASGRAVTGGTSTGAAPAAKTPAVNSRTSGSSRSTSTAASKSGTRGRSSAARDRSRIYRDRGAVSGSSGSKSGDGSQKSPAVNSGRKGNATGTSRGTQQSPKSTAPARTAPPRQSSPPPAVRSAPPSGSGAGAQSSGSSRGGSTRNPKP